MWRIHCLLLCVVLITSGVFGSDSALLADKAKVKYVVLISVDGLSASYLDDQRAELTNLRMLAKRGAISQGMITTFPSVTWPAHVSLVTGTTPQKHGVIGNAVWNRSKDKGLVYIGDPELTKDQAIRVQTLYDAAHTAGLKTASVIWPCSNGAKTLDWVIPDSNRAALHAKYTTPGFAKELAAAGINIAPLGQWGWGKEFATERDELYSKVTRYLLDKHHPNLLLLHYITPDGVEHAFGPNTPEAYKAVAESDLRVKEIWDALQEPPFKDQAALFVVSDHGFAHYEKLIQPNVLLNQLGFLETDEKGQVLKRHAWCVSQGGSAFLYVLDQAHKNEILIKVKEALVKVDGMQAILEPEQFTKLGLPHPKDNPEMADLVLTTGQGYSFQDGLTGQPVIGAGGYRGTHGHLPQPVYMHATFIATGAGIKSGVRLETIQNIDVAPTIARLLGVHLPASEGRVLNEILAD